MGEEIYLPLIEDIVWSYSSLSSFHECKYRWFLRYIKHYKQEDKFYASYGSFIHMIIEEFYSGKIQKEDMKTVFLSGFKKYVKGKRPSKSIVDKYIQKGCEYFDNFKPFPLKTLSIEEKIDFEIDGIKLTCRIDYFGEDEEDGGYIVIDNKSRDLKPRSTRKEPTLNDKLLDKMLRQLYLYSAAIKYKYGKFPKYLCFNCFKAGVLIKEPFVKEAYDETIQWVKDTVNEVKNTDDFYPTREYFACRYICGVSGQCCYDIEARKNEWRKKY